VSKRKVRVYDAFTDTHSLVDANKVPVPPPTPWYVNPWLWVVGLPVLIALIQLLTQ